jgi:carbonic anhydrase
LAWADTVAPRPKTGEQALRELMAGNRRFVRGRVENPRRAGVRRAAVAEKQKPFAVILGCSDSRVPPEIIFDVGIGDLFPVRVAGNTASTSVVVGSIQYGVLELGSLLIMVLGHEHCGAVKAAIEVVTEGATLPGDLPDVVQPIVPAVEQVADVPEELMLDAAVEANVRNAVQALEQDPTLDGLDDTPKLKIVGAEYNLTSGKVELLT